MAHLTTRKGGRAWFGRKKAKTDGNVTRRQDDQAACDPDCERDWVDEPPTGRLDPALIAALAVRNGVFADDATLGFWVLEALIENGWRIVRTDDCRHPEAPIGKCGCDEIRITEEWQP